MPHKMCLEPRCPNTAAYRGRCPTHSRQRERATHPNKAIYNSRRWRYARRKQLQANPLCEECGRMATDVDHVVPIERGGSVWDPANHGSLCSSCHGKKTRREQATR